MTKDKLTKLILDGIRNVIDTHAKNTMCLDEVLEVLRKFNLKITMVKKNVRRRRSK